MFERIAALTVRHARAVLVLAGILLVAGAVLGFGAFGKLQTGGFDDPGSQSAQATRALDAHFGGADGVVLLVRTKTGGVDQPAVAAVGERAAKQLASESGIDDVVSYWQTHDPSLRSKDGRSALVVAANNSDDQLSSDAIDMLTTSTPVASVSAGGDAAVSVDIGSNVGTSLGLAEGIAVPIVLILLVLAFGTFVSALLPLVVGLFAIMGTFAELFVIGSITDVAIYAINITTAMGLALGIDYALLLVNRFREELAGGASTEAAVHTAVRTAGRTIVFSGATVIAALAALLIFPLYFLRSFAYAGIGVVIIAILAALFVLPALLALLGPRVNAGRLPWMKRNPSTAAPFWGRVASLAWRHPVLIAAPVAIVLLLIASPLLHASVGTPDERVLRTDAPSRQVADALRADFTSDASNTIELVSTGRIAAAPLSDYAKTVSQLAGVERVQSSVGDFVAGQAGPADPADAALGNAGAQRLTVVTSDDPRSQAAQSLVRAIRALPAPAGVSVLVGGATASLIDAKHAIGVRLPIAAGWIVLTTFVVLFLFTGSLLQPLRSLVLNVLTLVATLGLMTWIFQDGTLSGALDFTPLPLDTSMLVLLFCIAFGLSMDYEVFVLSRVKELHDQGADNRTAVIQGLTSTGRIVTTAAALIAVSFLAFGISSVSFLQLFGLGAGFAVLIDATLVRAVLVPAAIRLLGKHAWSAPGPLARLHARVGIAEH